MLHIVRATRTVSTAHIAWRPRTTRVFGVGGDVNFHTELLVLLLPPLLWLSASSCLVIVSAPDCDAVLFSNISLLCILFLAQPLRRSTAAFHRIRIRQPSYR
jgi:hypothetical protein